MRKSSKERQMETKKVKRAKQAIYSDCEKHDRRSTWSARMPAYCYTVLCPDPRYRPKKEEMTIGQENTEPVHRCL